MSVARTSVSWEAERTVTNPFPSLVKKGPRSVRLSRHVRDGAEHLEPAACALRGIPPLVQPLPFATCRRRPVRERILACLRHFSRKRLARSLGPAQPDRTTMYKCMVSLLRSLYDSGKMRPRIAAGTKYRSTYRVKANRSYRQKHARYVSRVLS